MDTAQLSGKVALVTGAASGIGRATALALARRGARVAVNYRGNAANAATVVEAITAAGGEAAAFQADVTDLAVVRTMVQAIHERWDTIDILVNNAGGIPVRVAFAECDPQIWEQTIRLNLSSVYNCCHVVLPEMLTRGFGRIVNVSSLHVRTGGGTGGAVAYAAAKAAVIAMTRGIAMEVAGRGVLVNAIAPGLTDTPLQEGSRRESFLKAVERVPQGRAGQPEEMAEAICFLCSEATYTTGEVLFCTGGL